MHSWQVDADGMYQHNDGDTLCKGLPAASKQGFFFCFDRWVNCQQQHLPSQLGGRLVTVVAQPILFILEHNLNVGAKQHDDPSKM